MSLTILLIIAILLFAVELLYFRVADRYNIVDQPNHRSSHSFLTIRGGGIIFPFSLMLAVLYFGIHYGYFILGLILISFISFMDDIKPVSSKARITFHLIAVALLFYELGLFQFPFYGVLLAMFFVIGSINAINFMDGINGITGAYALITLCTLLYINTYIITFTASYNLFLVIISVLVFNFFNFRSRAKCFAGDVGSVSIAFIILFFLLQLMIKTANFSYIILLLLYGLDTVTTILFRFIKKEKLTEAHRSHLYQYLVNENKMSHLFVAVLYAIGQGIINVVLIFWFPYTEVSLVFTLLLSMLFFVGLRFWLEGRVRLLGN